MRGTRDAWVRIPDPLEAPRLRLYVIPYAGSGSAKFRTWSNQLPEGVELALVQLPARESRWGEPMPATLEALAAGLARSVRARADVPFALFGHSMGALVAFETARQLGPDAAPRLLVASGHRAPHLPPRRELHDMDEASLREAMDRLGGTPPEVTRDAELMKIFADLFRRDVTLSERYRAPKEAQAACPVRAYGGLQDAHARPDEIEAWRAHAGNGFAARFFDGGHFFIHSDEAGVLAALRQDLAPLLR